jgi:hypothetical protein
VDQIPHQRASAEECDAVVDPVFYHSLIPIVAAWCG